MAGAQEQAPRALVDLTIVGAHSHGAPTPRGFQSDVPLQSLVYESDKGPVKRTARLAKNGVLRGRLKLLRSLGAPIVPAVVAGLACLGVPGHRLNYR